MEYGHGDFMGVSVRNWGSCVRAGAIQGFRDEDVAM